ncbi:MAG: hypothetical protein HEP71_25225 [Roseivirga sp.]|nr:hypothetical protein [Roseivirga sp.]
MTDQSNIIQQPDAIPAEASLAGGKIAESLTKSFFKDVTSETTAEILGALGGGLGSIIVGAIIDFIDPPQETQIVDYSRIDAFIKDDLNQSALTTASSNIHAAAHFIFNNYAPLRKTVAEGAITVSDLINLDSDLNTALGHMINGSYLTQLANNKIGPIGIPVFIYGANLQLGIYQEQYKLYQEFNTQLKNKPGIDPAVIQSGEVLDKYEAYALPQSGTIAKTVNEHISSMDTNWQAAIDNRIKQVAITFSHTFTELTMAVTDGSNTPLSLTVDRPNSDFSDFVKGNLGARAENYCNTYYYPKIISALCQQMGYPDAVAATWSTLIDKPMGNQNADMILNANDQVDPTKLQTALTPKRKDHFIMETGGVTVLNPTDRLYATNRAFYLEFGTDGNLSVIRRSDNTVFWTTNLSNSAATSLTLTSGGDLQLTDASGSIVWSTNTSGDNYVFLQTNGILQVKTKGIFDENSGSQVKWSTKLGMLPASFLVDTNFSATSYIENNPKGKKGSAEMGALVFKQNNGNLMYASAALDGVNWVGPFALPSRMTTETGPGALGYGGAVITLFKGDGNDYIYLNASNPYIHGFGGLVELDTNVTTTTTPAAVGVSKMSMWSGTALNVLYTGNGNTNIYQWQMTDIGDSSGSMSVLQSGATNDSPQYVHFNNELYLVYREADGNGIYFKAGGNAPQLVPYGATTLSSPAVVVCGGMLYVIFRGTGTNRIWYSTYDGTTWSSPTGLFTDIFRTDTAPTAFALNNQVFVFAKGAGENNMYCAII